MRVLLPVCCSFALSCVCVCVVRSVVYAKASSAMLHCIIYYDYNKILAGLDWNRFLIEIPQIRFQLHVNIVNLNGLKVYVLAMINVKIWYLQLVSYNIFPLRCACPDVP